MVVALKKLGIISGICVVLDSKVAVRATLYFCRASSVYLDGENFTADNKFEIVDAVTAFSSLAGAFTIT